LDIASQEALSRAKFNHDGNTPVTPKIDMRPSTRRASEIGILTELPVSLARIVLRVGSPDSKLRLYFSID
jgi:hypothetical protein